MTERNIELTRRKILASAGAIGAAGAGAGLGTSALFNDEESFTNNSITAGTLDLLVDYYSYWDLAGTGQMQGTRDGSGDFVVDIADVKPGDNGLLAFCPRIETNPAYLWLCGELTANDENSVREPEAGTDPNNDTVDPAADIDGEGELAENIEITVSYCELDDDVGDGEGFEPDDVASGPPVWTGTLAEFFAAIEAGVPLDGDGPSSGSGSEVGFPSPGEQACFAGTDADASNPCLCVEWELPVDVGNEIQSDSVGFDLTFYAQQCRNNDGTNNPCCSCADDEVVVELADGTRRCVPVWDGHQSIGDFYDFAPYATQNPEIQDKDTTNLLVYEDENGDRHLVIVHDASNGVLDEDDATDGDVEATFSGLESSYAWEVRDDDPGNDTYDPIDSSTETVDWQWSAQYTDGGAIGTLSSEFDISIDATFNSGIGTVQYITEEGEPVVIADGVESGDAVTTRVYTCDE